MNMNGKDKIIGGSVIHFVNVELEININTAISMEAFVQIILAQDKDDTLIQDGFEVLDIGKINYMDIVIEDSDAISKFLKHHNEMGINLYDIADERANQLLDEYTNEEILQRFGSVRVVKNNLAGSQQVS